MMAGRRNFKVMCQITSNRLAPKFMAASSRVRSNFLSRAETMRVTSVEMKENWPKTTSQKPGRNNPTSIPQ